jgi:hypothetical protein
MGRIQAPAVHQQTLTGDYENATVADYNYAPLVETPIQTRQDRGPDRFSTADYHGRESRRRGADSLEPI